MRPSWRLAERNITGFNPQKFAEASGPSSRDPWKRNEAWRYSGPFSRRNRFRNAFPGLAIGTGAFIVYYIVDTLTTKKDEHHH